MSDDPLRAFRSALDEPAPPPPPEPSEDDGDDGDGHPFIHMQLAVPVLLVLRDGSVRTDGFGGSLLVAWWYLASFTTIGLVCYAVIATMVAHTAAVTWLVLVALGIAWVALIVAAIIVRLVPWWRPRRAASHRAARRRARKGSQA